MVQYINYMDLRSETKAVRYLEGAPFCKVIENYHLRTENVIRPERQTANETLPRYLLGAPWLFLDDPTGFSS